MQILWSRFSLFHSTPRGFCKNLYILLIPLLSPFHHIKYLVIYQFVNFVWLFYIIFFHKYHTKYLSFTALWANNIVTIISLTFTVLIIIPLKTGLPTNEDNSYISLMAIFSTLWTNGLSVWNFYCGKNLLVTKILLNYFYFLLEMVVRLTSSENGF